MHEDCDGKLKLPDQRVLLLNGECVGFDQSIPEFRHILVFPALTIERIEAHPRSCFLVVIADRGPYVITAGVETLQYLADREGHACIPGDIFLPFVIHTALDDKADGLVWLEERFKVPLYLFGRMPLIWLLYLPVFHPARINDLSVSNKFRIPVQKSALDLRCRIPPVINGELVDRPAGDRLC